MSRSKVVYYYEEDVGNFYYGSGHPMRPHRMRMTHNLVLNYGLYKKMEVYRPPKATFDDMTKFHTDEYIHFLKTVTPENMNEYMKVMHKFNVGEDCPVFSGMYDFCQISAGGSIAGAIKLNAQEADIAINWSGGLHHAKKNEASGFCYVNDIVLAIVELLKVHDRVLYIDTDCHHGDGVEEAFYTTNRVMTVSFHKFGDYFPGTGDLRDIGVDTGKHYALNFPLRDGIDDESFLYIFKTLISKVVDSFRPSAIVLQSGADSLAGDRLGCFNLSLKGHSGCVEFVKQLKIPMLLLGGGGYTIRNVARAWTNETAIALGSPISRDLPYNDYFEYYGPDYQIDVLTTNMENKNAPKYLEKTLQSLLENLRNLEAAPSVGQFAIPGHSFENVAHNSSNMDDDCNMDTRNTPQSLDKRIVCDEELSDSDKEYNGARSVSDYRRNNQTTHTQPETFKINTDQTQLNPVADIITELDATEDPNPPQTASKSALELNSESNLEFTNESIMPIPKNDTFSTSYSSTNSNNNSNK